MHRFSLKQLNSGMFLPHPGSTFCKASRWTRCLPPPQIFLCPSSSLTLHFCRSPAPTAHFVPFLVSKHQVPTEDSWNLESACGQAATLTFYLGRSASALPSPSVPAGGAEGKPFSPLSPDQWLHSWSWRRFVHLPNTSAHSHAQTHSHSLTHPPNTFARSQGHIVPGIRPFHQPTSVT